MEEQEKQAKVECNIIHGNKGGRRIFFYNSDLSDAHNVRIEILNKDDLDGVNIFGNWGPYDLITSRNGKREERIHLYKGHTDALKLRITWDDELVITVVFYNHHNYKNNDIWQIFQLWSNCVLVRYVLKHKI